LPGLDFKTLSDIDDWCRGQLARAVVDPKSPFRWPVLCTGGPEPAGRIVVLRAFDKRSREALFYTDGRSQKCRHLMTQSRAECVFFDRKKMIQIRCRGEIFLHQSGEIHRQHFARVQAQQWRDYAADKAPGTPINGDTRVDHLQERANQNFAALALQIESVDWLSLSRDGHKRALLDWSPGKSQHQWLVP